MKRLLKLPPPSFPMAIGKTGWMYRAELYN